MARGIRSSGLQPTCQYGAHRQPERFLQDRYHADTDIWSLGLSLLECALGRFPYPEPDESGNIAKLEFWNLINYISQSPAPSAPVSSSDDFKDFIRICLGKEPGTRSSAKELLLHPFIQRHKDPEAFRQWLATIPSV